MKKIVKKILGLLLVVTSLTSCGVVGNVDKNDFTFVDENGMYHLSVWNEITPEHEEYQKNPLFTDVFDENFITKTKQGKIIDLYDLPNKYYYEVKDIDAEFETKTYKISGVSFAEGYNATLNISIFVEYHGNIKDKDFGNVNVYIYENNILTNKEFSYSSEKRKEFLDNIEEGLWKGETNENLWNFKG